MSKFSVDEIPDHTGKVVLVTGGNSGIGKETCKQLLLKGARVYMGARSKVRADEALADIKRETGKEDIHWLEMDLADLTSVSNAAKTFLAQEKELHTLYNNAGIMATTFARSKDGIEEQFATNVVGHFALTKLLLPTLLKTAKNTPPGTVRVINVSSMGHQFAPRGGIHFEDTALEGYWFAEWQRYGQTKLGNILMTKEIARLYADQGIYSLAMHPGNIATNLNSKTSYGQTWFGALSNKVLPYILISPADGALTQLYAGTSQEVVDKDLNGAYLVPYAKMATPSSYAQDPALATKLWDYLEDLVKDKI
eukprot:TRINITY_DN8300_c0_g1_i3.p1 TRINITY_DN8300_c0_g1~~TRINITY_DN8300_c0_g1_i3.p1  ORF type:complete len:319 (+),score=70.57 TRINITY_DN8300_c0_g1_i3:32-958(+)